MTQKRLKALSLMAIESELTKTLDFDDIMDDFARSRAPWFHNPSMVLVYILVNNEIRRQTVELINAK